MGTIASQSTSLTQLLIQAQIKENIKAPHHWPLFGEVTGTGEFPAQRDSNAEYVSIWWRHHVLVMILQSIAQYIMQSGNGDAKTWKVMSNWLNIILTDGDIQDWSCNI